MMLTNCKCLPSSPLLFLVCKALPNTQYPCKTNGVNPSMTKTPRRRGFSNIVSKQSQELLLKEGCRPNTLSPLFLLQWELLMSFPTRNMLLRHCPVKILTCCDIPSFIVANKFLYSLTVLKQYTTHYSV